MDDKLEKMGAPKKEGQSQMESVALSMTTLGRVSIPEDVANAVAFLAGPDSDWVTGQVCNFVSTFRYITDNVLAELGGRRWNRLQLTLVEPCSLSGDCTLLQEVIHDQSSSKPE